MALFKSSNPTLNEKTFQNILNTDTTEVMTVQGTVNKTGVLGLIVFASALFTWNMFSTDVEGVLPYLYGGAIGGLVVAIVLSFKQSFAPFLAPVYALLEGLVLGGISAAMNAKFPGIAFQAILLTFGILFGMLILYRLNIIRATEKFKLIIFSATAGIMLYYLVSLGARLIFHYQVPLIYDSGPAGIIFSLVVVAIAALNLVLDFDMIERGAAGKAPKYMEWYGAFALMVTIIWLYIEILRLLSKLKKK